ncbi:MAG: STAS/SEC14 domain-containing protein [Sphingomonadaceae bacterium]|nr:STAS/SEC14 domain-containing protein [Sphingomonadaceae bacterium]
MLKFIRTDDDVIAFRMTGHVDRAEVEAVLDRLEKALDLHRKTHMFVEIEAFKGFDVSAITHDLTRSLKLLGKLKRFGRVAIVSDTSWIRWASKVESALLPFVSYETFKADERDKALAWVKGEQRLPHGAAIKKIETDRPNVFGFELDGKISSEELKEIAEEFNSILDKEEKVNVIARIKTYDGLELEGLLESDFWAMKLAGYKKLDRYAVVGGPEWMKRWGDLLSPLFRVNIQFFDEDEEGQAWEWLKAKPRIAEPVIA